MAIQQGNETGGTGNNELNLLRELREIEESYRNDGLRDGGEEWLDAYRELREESGHHIDDEVLGYVQKTEYQEAIQTYMDNLMSCPWE